MAAEIMMAGFGGQGVLFIGQLLTHAGMLLGKEVSYVPSYGAEMRGGTANCSVIIADEPIRSPLIEEPTHLVALNQASLDLFQPRLLSGGLLLWNSSLIQQPPSRSDISIYSLPANQLADDLGSTQVANMVILGGLIGITGLVTIDAVLESLSHILPVEKHGLLARNRQALELGAEKAMSA